MKKGDKERKRKKRKRTGKEKRGKYWEMDEIK